MSSKPTLIVLAGPTAVGKTSAAIHLAQEFNADIVNADSRQLYREMNIGTAVPSQEELAQATHHLIQTQSIFNPVSAGDYEDLALHKVMEIFKSKSTVILTGGSGLFIDALVSGIDNNLPPANEEIRSKLEKMKLDELQKLLQELDPIYYQEVDQHNAHRLIRAIEVCEITGEPYSSLRSNLSKTRPFETIKLCLNMERALLYDRINRRVDQMMEAGLLKEAQSLFEHRHLKSLSTVGYSELFRYMNQEIDLEEAVELIKRNTRRYAKRQLTWFKRDKNYQWFDANKLADMVKFIETSINSKK